MRKAMLGLFLVVPLAWPGLAPRFRPRRRRHASRVSAEP